jgi:diguanylate cyclase (GGDEF)-like protein
MKVSIKHSIAILIALIVVSAVATIFSKLLSPFGNIVVFLGLFAFFSILMSITAYYVINLINIIKSGMRAFESRIDLPKITNEEEFSMFRLLHSKSLIKLFRNYESAFEAAKVKLDDNEMKFKELERINNFKNHTLDTLLKVNHLFLNLKDSKDYYAMILASAIDVIENASKGSILLYNPDIDKFEFQTCIGFDFNELSKVKISLEETFLFQNSHGNYDEPIIIKNVREYDSEILDTDSNKHMESAGGLDISEALSSPIIIDGQIFAIINIDSDIENAFDEIDKQLLHFFASQISVALKNKYLVDETVNMSRYDKLTGAFNRNYFEKMITAHREQTLENMESYALVLCDLNYLKIINDSFGHSAGDAILKAFSDMITSSIRDTDVLSRIGGDEFVILLRNISLIKAEEKMAQVFSNIKDHKINYQGHELPVSFSYGVSASPDDSMIYDILIKIADIRMYKFKETYKNDHPEFLNMLSHF